MSITLIVQLFRLPRHVFLHENVEPSSIIHHSETSTYLSSALTCKFSERLFLDSTTLYDTTWFQYTYISMFSTRFSNISITKCCRNSLFTCFKNTCKIRCSSSKVNAHNFSAYGQIFQRALIHCFLLKSDASKLSVLWKYESISNKSRFGCCIVSATAPTF